MYNLAFNCWVCSADALREHYAGREACGVVVEAERLEQAGVRQPSGLQGGFLSGSFGRKEWF